MYVFSFMFKDYVRMQLRVSLWVGASLVDFELIVALIFFLISSSRY